MTLFYVYLKSLKNFHFWKFAIAAFYYMFETSFCRKPIPYVKQTLIIIGAANGLERSAKQAIFDICVLAIIDQ